jgi:chorismate dehydratase
MTIRLLRLGFHGFLNALPLLNLLQRNSLRAGFEMVVDNPSVIADKLHSGQLDLAMIPSIEYLKDANSFKLLPGICIASRGRVLTVLLISKLALSEVRTVALDSRSRTSVALLRILFGDRFHSAVRYESVEPDIDSMLKIHDSALVIGDQALKFACPKGMTVYDLSQEWFELTGQAFVHAVVAVRPDVSITDEMKETILAVNQKLPSEITEVVKAQAVHYDEGLCEDYLRNRIRYTLGEEEIQGLARFRDMSYDRGLIAQKHPIGFI